MDRSTDLVCTAVDALTAELIRDLLATAGVPSSVVARGFDGVTIGHTPRDHAVHVAAGVGPTAREILIQTWGRDAVQRLAAPAPER